MTPEKDPARIGIINAIKEPLGIFVLALLILESILLLVAIGVDGLDKTILIVGTLALMLITLIIFAWFYRQREDNQSLPQEIAEDQDEYGGTTAIEFEPLLGEISKTIKRLEDEDRRIEVFLESGETQRLLDALYSALLYTTGAIVTGRLNPIYYGNMFEWHESSDSLAVRYFNGPYSDEVIIRHFPLTPPNMGVASEAIVTGKIQCRDSMEDLLTMPGEAWLKSMMSIPVVPDQEKLKDGEIAVVNIDSVIEDAFADSGESGSFDHVTNRAQEVAEAVERVNKLRRKIVSLQEKRCVVDFETMVLPDEADKVAPDGSHVRELLTFDEGSMAHFQLDPNQISTAVVHRSIQEIWFFQSGRGEMWRWNETQGDSITLVEAGVCISLPVGTYFQLRAFDSGALTSIAVSLPAWPADDEKEAVVVDGKWEPS